MALAMSGGSAAFADVGLGPINLLMIPIRFAMIALMISTKKLILEHSGIYTLEL